MERTRPPAAVPSPAGPGRSSAWPLIAVCTGYFMVILDTTVVNVALPALSHGLHTSTTGLQWVVDGYSLVFAALLLSAGALADRRGARRVFQAGLVLFTLASAGCGLAPTTGLLVAARCLQGLGAALAVPASLALLQAAYPDRAARARAIGIWGGVAGIAAGAGPVAGGALVAVLGWRSVFFLNLPFGVAGLALAARYLPAPPPRAHGTDLAGQVTAGLSLAALTGALIEAGPRGWASPLALAGLALAVAAALAFAAIERKVRSPLLPPGLFATGAFRAGNAVGLLINLGFYGELFVLTLYLQQLRGLSPLRAGAALLPQLGMAAIGSTVSGRIMARTGPWRPMLAGLLTGGAGLAGLAAAGAHSPYWLLVVPMMATGLGMSVTMPAATATVLDSAPGSRAGLASGTVNAARQLGGVIGVALLGTLIASRADFLPGLRTGMLIAAAAFLTGAVLTALAVGRRGPGPRLPWRAQPDRASTSSTTTADTSMSAP